MSPNHALAVTMALLLIPGVTHASAGSLQAAGPDVWSETAQDDLHFIRATLRVNHPGPYDQENPWFGDWYRRGFQQALDLATRANSFAGYYFAVTYYMRGFQDGHLGALADSPLQEPRLTARWPGFLVMLRGNDFVVAESSSPDQPPPGARLTSCDGRSTEDLVAEIVRPYVHLWNVRAARGSSAPLILIDTGNPFVRRPEVCTFENQGGTRSYSLRWNEVASEELRTKIASHLAESAPEFAVRATRGGGYWISLPSFALGDTRVQSGIDSVVRQIADAREGIRNANHVVIDVRGNGGGAARLGEEVAAALWGEELIEALPPSRLGDDWRVSARNAAFLRTTNLARLVQRYGEQSTEAASYRGFVDRMDAAAARGDIYLSIPFADGGRELRARSATSPVRGRVFFLTDSACFSACLDFADMVLALPGVVHIGSETRADAIYIDNRTERLPSGNGLVGFSMKVNRGRRRAHNESYIPEHAWTGAMGDTVGIERWVGQLARGSR